MPSREIPEQAVLLGVLNSLVHTIMYIYYFLAGLGPEVQKYLCRKRYLTKLQLTQFVIAIGYMFFLYYNKCTVSKAYYALWLTNVVVILALFINFYIQTYIWKPAQTANLKKTE